MTGVVQPILNPTKGPIPAASSLAWSACWIA